MPQRPNTSGAQGAKLDAQDVPVAFIIRLDVVGDPVYAWTGFGDLAFAASGSGELITNGDASQAMTYGAELLTNGDFGSGSTGWSVTGTDATHTVTFSGGTARYQSNTSSPVLQMTNAFTAVSGTMYEMTVVASAFGSGSLKAQQAGWDSNQVGNVNGVGTFKFYGKGAGSPLSLYRNASPTDITLDSVSLKQVTVPGWTPAANNGSAVAIVGGKLRVIAADGTATPYAYQAITTVVGRTYVLRVDGFAPLAPSPRVFVGTSIGGAQLLASSVALGTDQSFMFTATSTTTYVHIGSSASSTGTYVEFDNVSVKQDGVLAATGDSALDGYTFAGITHLVAEIGAMQDAVGGSNALEITLPGVDLTDEAMRQVVYNEATWQFKPAWVWLAILDDTGTPIGVPIRLKSGRMDQMEVEETEDGEGVIRCIIEGHQAYGGESLATRYSEQSDVDATDTSQKWVWQLANMSPSMGEKYSLPGGTGVSGGGIAPRILPSLVSKILKKKYGGE